MSRDWPAAIAALRRGRGSLARAFLAQALARGGQREEALAILADLTNSAKRTGHGAFQVAVVYAGLGDRDRSFEWLNRSVDDASLTPQIMLPLFDDLHSDPRFEQLRSRLRFQNR